LTESYIIRFERIAVALVVPDAFKLAVKTRQNLTVNIGDIIRASESG